MFINAQGSRLPLCPFRWTLLFRIRCRCVSLENRKSAFEIHSVLGFSRFWPRKQKINQFLTELLNDTFWKNYFLKVFLLLILSSSIMTVILFCRLKNKKRVTSEKRIIDKLKKENERKGKQALATATHFSPWEDFLIHRSTLFKPNQ